MCYVMKAPFSSSPVLCLLMPVHVQCDHSVWLWVINNLSERKIQVKRPPSKPQSLPLSWNGRMTNLSDSGKNSLVTSVPPKLLHYSMLYHIGWKCQLWEKLVVNRCFVIDIRSYCFFEVCFPGLSPTEIVRNQCWSQFNTSTDNNTYCVGALWDSGQGGLVFIQWAFQWMCALHGFYCIIYIPGPHGNSSALYTD